MVEAIPMFSGKKHFATSFSHCIISMVRYFHIAICKPVNIIEKWPGGERVEVPDVKFPTYRLQHRQALFFK
jgi:hypothetical protein